MESTVWQFKGRATAGAGVRASGRNLEPGAEEGGWVFYRIPLEGMALTTLNFSLPKWGWEVGHVLDKVGGWDHIPASCRPSTC